MKKDEVLINILTRTSNRPVGFNNCRHSILKQTYKNIKHVVSYENTSDLAYLDYKGIIKIKVEKYNGDVLIDSGGNLHAPYNLYCNALLDKVDNGWVLFLDDDDNFLHNSVIKSIVSEINVSDEDTLFIWQMRYPDGKLLPSNEQFRDKLVAFEKIGSPCFMFHSKYKDVVKWDEWKGSDYRVVKKLLETIPNKKWIEKPYIQINNFGDLGNRNDIRQNSRNKMLFEKPFFRYLIIKYQSVINANRILQVATYKQFWESGLNKIKRVLRIK